MTENDTRKRHLEVLAKHTDENFFNLAMDMYTEESRRLNLIAYRRGASVTRPKKVLTPMTGSTPSRSPQEQTRNKARAKLAAVPDGKFQFMCSEVQLEHARRLASWVRNSALCFLLTRADCRADAP
jgi:hypothetical protein